MVPQKLRPVSWSTCFNVSMRKPSQSVSAIQYLKHLATSSKAPAVS